MKTVLLDTNCLIDLAEGSEPAAALSCIVSNLRDSGYRLAVAAITASENPRKGSPPKTWSEFTGLLDSVGLADVEILAPMGYWNVVFWEHALWVDDDMVALESSIHVTLFPSFAMDDDSDERRWRNAKCDVQVVWTAMWNGVDILITSDRKIASRAPKLAQIRPVEVLTPPSFLHVLEGSGDPPMAAS